MDNKEIKELIEAFRAYRELLTPIQSNLSDFVLAYESVKENTERLSNAFGGGIKESLESIYKNLSSQAEKELDLSSRIDQFSKATTRYLGDLNRLMEAFSKMESKVNAINDLEHKAEEQIGRLDALLSERAKSYNIKELQRTLDSYNSNVTRVSEFINKDVGDTLSSSQKKIDTIKKDLDMMVAEQKGQAKTLEELLVAFTQSGEFLKEISNKQDVNEAYIFDILDAWAEKRKIKIKK